MITSFASAVCRRRTVTAIAEALLLPEARSPRGSPSN